MYAAETKLMEISKWARYSISPTGYWPLSLTETESGQSFEVKSLSRHTVSLLVQLVGFSAWFYLYFTRLGTSLRPVIDESIALGILCTWNALLVAALFLLKVTCFARRYRALKFWKSTVQLFSQIETIGRDMFGNDLASDELFQNLGKEIRNSFWIRTFLLICYAFYVAYVQVYFLETHQLERYYFVAVIGFSVASDSGNVIWLSLFIKIYTVSYQLIGDGIRDTTNKDSKRLFIIKCNLSNVPGRLTPDENVEKILQLYSSLENEIRLFNGHFWICILIQVFLSTSVVLCYGFFIFVYFGVQNTAILVVIFQPVLFYSLDLFKLCTLSSMLGQRAMESIEQLQKYSGGADRNLQFKIQLLVTRTSNQPPSINVGGFFAVNRNLVTSICGALLTYTIVLFQFQNNADEE